MTTGVGPASDASPRITGEIAGRWANARNCPAPGGVSALRGFACGVPADRLIFLMTELFNPRTRPLAAELVRRVASWLGACLLLAACTAAAREPLFVVRVAGVNRLLEDVDYHDAWPSGRSLAGFVRGLPGIVNDLRGSTGPGPICLAAYVPADGKVGKHMDVVLLVPVTRHDRPSEDDRDDEAGQARRGRSLRASSFSKPRRTIPVRVIDGWAVCERAGGTAAGPVAGVDRRDVGRLAAGCVGAAQLVRASRRRSGPKSFARWNATTIQERTQRESEDEAEFAIRQGILDVLLTAGRTILRDLDGTVSDGGHRLRPSAGQSGGGVVRAAGREFAPAGDRRTARPTAQCFPMR